MRTKQSAPILKFRNPADLRALARALKRGFLVAPSKRVRLPNIWFRYCFSQCLPCVATYPRGIVAIYPIDGELALTVHQELLDALAGASLPGWPVDFTPGVYYAARCRAGAVEFVASFAVEILLAAGTSDEGVLRCP